MRWQIGEDNRIIRLSPALKDELCCLAVLGPLAAFDLRANFVAMLVLLTRLVSGWPQFVLL